jgi:hypothetical protein
MGRSRQRANLQEGLKLDLNKLARQNLICPGARTTRTIRWSYTYTNETIVHGLLNADMSDSLSGWLRIEIGELSQTIRLHRLPRHYGGGQWYFSCPYRHIRCSVVWMPPGAKSFASRQAWGRQVAYGSQFQGWYERALTKAQGLRARLGGPDWAGIDETDPPKPKWMRWRTYYQIVARSRDSEAIADQHTFALVARLMRRG